VRQERRDLIGAPHPKWHRRENCLEPGAIFGGEQTERSPFAWLQWRAPQAQKVSLCRELARPCGLTGADFVDGCV
jgi:hypothetical protein